MDQVRQGFDQDADADADTAGQGKADRAEARHSKRASRAKAERALQARWQSQAGRHYLQEQQLRRRSRRRRIKAARSAAEDSSISLYNRDSGPGAPRKTVSPFGGQVPWTLPRLSWTLPRPNLKSGLKPRCSAALLLGAIWVSFWSPGLSQTVLFGSLFVHFVVSGAKVRNALPLQREHDFGGFCGSQIPPLGPLEANQFG